MLKILDGLASSSLISYLLTLLAWRRFCGIILGDLGLISINFGLSAALVYFGYARSFSYTQDDELDISSILTIGIFKLGISSSASSDSLNLFILSESFLISSLGESSEGSFFLALTFFFSNFGYSLTGFSELFLVSFLSGLLLCSSSLFLSWDSSSLWSS